MASRSQQDHTAGRDVKAALPYRVKKNPKDLPQRSVLNTDNLEALSAAGVGSGGRWEVLVRQHKHPPLRFEHTLVVHQDLARAAAALQVVGVKAHHDVELLMESKINKTTRATLVPRRVE